MNAVEWIRRKVHSDGRSMPKKERKQRLIITTTRWRRGCRYSDANIPERCRRSGVYQRESENL